MTQRITLLTAACVLGATAVLAGCAVSPGASDLDQLTARIFQKSFRDEGIVKVAAMAQDDATREDYSMASGWSFPRGLAKRRGPGAKRQRSDFHRHRADAEWWQLL